MKSRSIFPGGTSLATLGAAFAALLLILDSATAADAMVQGLLLCLQTVIPSLFPLMVMTRLLMHTDLPGRLGKTIGPAMGPLFGQPPQAAVCLILGIVGGYPAGAQSVAIAYERGELTHKQAERLLSFCNNAGPAFVFGMVGALLGGLPVATTLYVIHILSALLTGIMLKPHGDALESRINPGKAARSASGQILFPSIRAMAMICAYVLLFRVLVVFLEKYLGGLMPQVIKIAISGVLELSGGCLRLKELESAGWQYCMASGFLSFGGLCVFMQTKSVIGISGLKGRYYFMGKLLQGTISVLLTWGVMVFLPGLLPRHTAAVYLPNHEGLLTTMLWVFGAFSAVIGIWCLMLRNRAGKEQEFGV